MRDLIFWYSKRRKLIWSIIITILVVFLGLKLLNMAFGKNTENTNSNTNFLNQYNSIILDTEESVISGDKLTTNQKNNVNIIDTFVKYCNDEDIENAYNLLSEDCKNEMYSNINIFKTSYYSRIFGNESKDVVVKNWTSNIYKVDFKEDLLAAGGKEERNSIQDYMTVVLEDNKQKININGYIGSEKINKFQNYNNIDIKVTERKRYMEYEIYTFEVTNNSYVDITLADKDELNPIYLEDENGLQYAAYMHEITEEQLDVLSGETKKISIKFYNRFSSSKRIEKICFSNIIYDYRKRGEKRSITIEL